MIKKVICLLLINILFSCNFFSPIEENIQTQNIEISEKEIIGTWKMDKFSYEYLFKNKELDSIYIIFKSDSTFFLNNSINLFDKVADLSLGEKINGKLDNAKSEGKWEITNYKNSKYNTLSLVFKNETKISFDVYKKGDNYQIWYFFNDPDTGQRLRFLK